MAKKKLDSPMWFKEAFASYRVMRARGDLSTSEMYELLADDIQGRQEAGEPFGRFLWIDFITSYDGAASKAQIAAADEERALAEATGYLQEALYSKEILEKLGLPSTLDLGEWGKKISTLDADYAHMERALKELLRKKDSWDESLEKKIRATERALAILPADNSRTLRQVIADPDEYGYGTEAQ